ncbi:unnamed protein product [Amoebophrya sp. A120]|nr:unnamed protein product [Amoebophrya sp. A120]|eukprot:GSA120T00006853001.1
MHHAWRHIHSFLSPNSDGPQARKAFARRAEQHFGSVSEKVARLLLDAKKDAEPARAMVAVSTKVSTEFATIVTACGEKLRRVFRIAKSVPQFRVPTPQTAMEIVLRREMRQRRSSLGAGRSKGSGALAAVSRLGREAVEANEQAMVAAGKKSSLMLPDVVEDEAQPQQLFQGEEPNDPQGAASTPLSSGSTSSTPRTAASKLSDAAKKVLADALLRPGEFSCTANQSFLPDEEGMNVFGINHRSSDEFLSQKSVEAALKRLVEKEKGKQADFLPTSNSASGCAGCNSSSNENEQGSINHLRVSSENEDKSRSFSVSSFSQPDPAPPLAARSPDRSRSFRYVSTEQPEGFSSGRALQLSAESEAQLLLRSSQQMGRRSPAESRSKRSSTPGAASLSSAALAAFYPKVFQATPFYLSAPKPHEDRLRLTRKEVVESSGGAVFGDVLRTEHYTTDISFDAGSDFKYTPGRPHPVFDYDNRWEKRSNTSNTKVWYTMDRHDFAILESPTEMTILKCYATLTPDPSWPAERMQEQPNEDWISDFKCGIQLCQWTGE